jgi:hypothetical protein
LIFVYADDRRLVGPGFLEEGPAGECGAGFGDAALAAACAPGVRMRGEAPIAHERSGVLKTAQVADRRVLDFRDLDERQIAGAHESGQVGRLASSGVGAVARLLRDQSRGHDPADQFFLGEIALKPVPAGASCVNKDQLLRFRGEGADELVTVALARTATPQEDDRCLPRIADRGNGEKVLVHIQSDEECGRVRHG